MTFLVSSEHSSPSSAHAVKVQGDGGVFLIDASGCRLNVKTLDDKAAPFLISKFYADLSSPIAALCSFVRDGENCIGALLHDRIHIFTLSATGLSLTATVPLQSVSGHQNASDIDPILIAHSAGESSILLLYKYTGFVSVFDVSKSYLASCSNSSKSSRRSRLPYEGSRTVSIGNIIVSSMCFVQREDPLLAVLYRDVDFNYSLRYYGFSEHKLAPSVVNQMELFSGAPSCLVPVRRGLLVASDVKLWFFPPPDHTVNLSSAAGDAVFPVSKNTLHNVVTLDMSANASEYSGCRFQCSTQIDENRFLLISDRGTSLLVYIESTQVRESININDFKIIDLGKSTIASSVVHLDANVFYAASRVSRSVLFRILPHTPYVHILSTLTNSSPVLNINVRKSAYASDLLLSRGGMYSGELEFVDHSPYVSQRIASVSVDTNISRISSVLANGSHLIALWADSQNYNSTFYLAPTLQRSDDFPLDSTSRLKLESSQKSGPGRSHTWTIAHDKALILAHTNCPTFSYILHSHTVSISVPQMDEVTSVEWFDSASFELLAVSWNGILVYVIFGAQSAKVVLSLQTGLRGHISIGRVPINEQLSLVVLVDGEGNLEQILLAQNEDSSEEEAGIEHSNVLAQHSIFAHHADIEGTFRMTSNKNNAILIYDARSVYCLWQQSDCLFANPEKVFSSPRPFCACELVDTTEAGGRFAVVCNDGLLELHSFSTRVSREKTYHSDKLIQKSLDISEKYTVALQLSQRPNLSSGQMERMSSLLLLERHTLREIHVYKPESSTFFVDMCLMEDKYNVQGRTYVVAANSANDPEKILSVFYIKANRIKFLSNISVNGMLPSTFALSKICCQKNHVFLVGDIFAMFTLEDTPDKKNQCWRAQMLEHDNSPFYGVDVDANDDFCVIGDAIRGLFITSKGSKFLKQLVVSYKPSFVTSVAVLQNSAVVFYGDAVGNLGAIMRLQDSSTHQLATDQDSWNDLSFSQIFAANIGEAINDIVVVQERPIEVSVGTVQGNVYKIQDVDSYPLAIEVLKANHCSDQPCMSWRHIDATEMVKEPINVIDQRKSNLLEPLAQYDLPTQAEISRMMVDLCL